MSDLILADGPRVVGKLGKNDAIRPVGKVDLIRALIGSLPVHPPLDQGPQGVVWGMDGNDTLGDCTYAGEDHAEMATDWLLGLRPISLGALVGKDYLVDNGGIDNGDVETWVLSRAESTGLIGRPPIKAWYPIQGSEDWVSNCIYAFGCIYCGYDLPAPAQQQFANGEPFDLTGTPDDDNIIGGHCMIEVAYDMPNQEKKLVTWATENIATERWLQRYRTESYVQVTHNAAQVGAIRGVPIPQLVGAV